MTPAAPPGTAPFDAALVALSGLDLPALVIGTALLFARLGSVLMLLPGFSDDAVPGRMRLLIAFGMAAGLYGLLGPALRPAVEAARATDSAFATALMAEILTGLLLGAILRILFLAISIAGSIISLQVGLTSALVNDPSAGGQVPVLARFISVAALLVCFALNVHHLWIAAMVDSYALFPAGAMPPAADFAQLAIRAASGSMALGLSLAAPIVIYGIVFNGALGLAARLAPQLQVFFIGQPLAILLGLALIAASLGATLTAFADRMAGWMHTLFG